ncbi:MAG: ROK family protein [Chloroflexota bacterium]|nr:ROK family protein [Chloroflexota bacterium]MDQ5866727.1 ROK family protein [Chloroflexota bacterium]
MSVSNSPILGIDVGGTKLAAGVVSGDGGVLSYARDATPSNLDGEGLLDFLLRLARRAIDESSRPPVGVGIGCGGPMVFPEGIVSPLHIPAWQDFPLRARVESALGLPTLLDNDAKAFALGEALFGAGKGARCMLGMVVSTGVGGGIVVNGKLVDGASGNAGHVGHVLVSKDGPRCYCGGHGCLTVYASGTGLAARAREALEQGIPSILASLPPEQVTGEAVAQAAAQGDPLGVDLMQSAAQALGMGIASVANLLDLDRVVIGGGVSQSGGLLFKPLQEELRRRATLAFSRGVEVHRAKLGQEAGVIGSAGLVFQRIK